jgi:hypothetical protein
MLANLALRSNFFWIIIPLEESSLKRRQQLVAGLDLEFPCVEELWSLCRSLPLAESVVVTDRM